MRPHGPRTQKILALPLLATPLLLATCSQPAAQSGPTPSLSPPTPSNGHLPCALITPAIVAARIGPNLTSVGRQSPDEGSVPGGHASGCAYSGKTKDGKSDLSIILASPASTEYIAQLKETPDCSPVAGIGDFACEQWTGYFRGQPDASANVILIAVRADNALRLAYVTGPVGKDLPDGNAMARAIALLAVDAGWGNGNALRVPAAPPTGIPQIANSPVCGLVTADAVGQAFGTTVPRHACPSSDEGVYTFG